jgi:hypothetical protein
MNAKITRQHSIHKLRVYLAAEYSEDVIDMFAYSNVGDKQKLKERFDKEIKEFSEHDSLSEEEKYELEGAFSDELFLCEETEELSREMTIIAFYKTIEIAIKKMLEFSQLFTLEQIKTFYLFDRLKKQVNEQQICDIETLCGYAAYNELRLINNCIKHSGTIDEKLSIPYPIWNNGEKLQNLDKAYFRLKDDVNKFLKTLRDEILAKM